MTREECDVLRRDLDAAGVAVVRIEEPAPGVFWLVHRSERLRVDFTVTNATRFREIVVAGLKQSLPASTFTPPPPLPPANPPGSHARRAGRATTHGKRRKAPASPFTAYVV